MMIHGSCHCGNIRFELDWEPAPTKIPARACDCTFCSKHGGVWTSNPAGALTVLLQSPERVSRYAFGTHTAQFHVCSNCGVVPLVTSDINDKTYAVVSVNAFNNVEASLLQHSPASFDGEEKDARLARRARGWIPEVRFVNAQA